jgi:hypothetical protein
MTRMPGFTADVALSRSRGSYPGRRLPSDPAATGKVGVVPSIFIEVHPEGTTGLYGEGFGQGEFGVGWFGGGGGGNDGGACFWSCVGAYSACQGSPLGWALWAVCSAGLHQCVQWCDAQGD